jgi:hypothetical protein
MSHSARRAADAAVVARLNEQQVGDEMATWHPASHPPVVGVQNTNKTKHTVLSYAWHAGIILSSCWKT